MSQNEQINVSEQIQEHPDADVETHEQTVDTDLGTRARTMTEKGKEYTIASLETRFK